MPEQQYYLPVGLTKGPAQAFSPTNPLRWVGVLSTLIVVSVGGYLGWNWMHDHIFSIGIEDAGQVTVNQASLLEQVRTFELVTVKDTYDSRSHTAFDKRLNTGFTKIGLPGWVAGQELDVTAKVTVAAGVDMAQIQPGDIEVIQNGQDAVVVVRIPEARVMSTEIDAGSFDISTSSGILTRLGNTVGLHDKDVRDSAVGAVSSLARDQATADGILVLAQQEARTRLQAFLQGLPQTGPGHITYLVEQQDAAPH